MKTIYLAGPDVFLPDATTFGAHKKELCAAHGFEGLFPLDNEIAATSPNVMSEAIYAANVAMIARADCGILNLTPFHGPSADVGTVFELGLLVGLSKPVFAYTNAAEDFLERLKSDPGLVYDRPANVWRDRFGMVAEDFGNADNLMIDAALAQQGRLVHRVSVPAERQYNDLAGFLICLYEARAYFAQA